VAAAAVAIGPANLAVARLPGLAAVDDSKRLSAEQREELAAAAAALAAAGVLRYACGLASVAEIARLNILGATCLAMERAVRALMATGLPAPAPPAQAQTELALSGARPAPLAPASLLLVDGRPMRRLPWPHWAIVGGDHRSFVIALASIIAKVSRDRLLIGLDQAWPAYGFAAHKGYGTAAHRASISRHGPCPQHRRLFLRKLATGKGAVMDEMDGMDFMDTMDRVRDPGGP
jgi:ribonuclease HII